jgi:hypothetical protein
MKHLDASLYHRPAPLTRPIRDAAAADPPAKTTSPASSVDKSKAFRLIQVIRSWRFAFRRQELRYGDPFFVAASELARSLPDSPRPADLLTRLARDRSLVRVLLAVWRLPAVEFRATGTALEPWSAAYFEPRKSSRRAQAVLELPAVEKQYLTGRPKQALRTNLSHARKNGITSVRVASYEEWLEDLSVVLKARGDLEPEKWDEHKIVPGQEIAYYVARDAEQTPLACARVAVFGQFGALFSMLSRPDMYPSTSWARYQLHTFLALDLGSSGVEYLQVGSAFKEADGTQFFQHLVGYRARNIRLKVS